MTPESEAQTRRKRINLPLRQLRWEILPFSKDLNEGLLQQHAVTEHSIASGPSHDVLCVSEKFLGVRWQRSWKLAQESC